MGERRGAYRVLVGKPEGKRPPGRTRRISEANIKMDLQEDWIYPAQNKDIWRELLKVVLRIRVL
jgi:hypothetical protein